MRRLVVGTLLALIPRVAVCSTPTPWVEARSAHFVVLCDAGEKDARRLAMQFERMRLVFQTIFQAASESEDASDVGAPITVIAVRDRREMQALEPAAYAEKGHTDLSGMFLRSAEENTILVRLDAPEEHAFSTVYHEYTHYMLRRADAWMPLWLNEGLAQFYENTEIGEKQVLLGEANAEQLRYLKLNPLLPVATLFTVGTQSPYYHDEQKASIFYAESWALAHYLLAVDRASGTHRVHDYTERLSQSEDPVTAARHAFGDLDALQSALSAYIAQRSLPYFTLPAAIPSQDAILRVRAVSIAEADAAQARAAICTGRMEEARALLDAALREDPGYAPAHETMGLLRYREGDLPGACKWYGEAMRLDPLSYTAQYDFAEMSLRAGSRGEDEVIESSLRTSIGLNPQFAPAYDALAMFYSSRHRSLDDAYALSLRAIELQPDSLSYRVDCAELLAQRKQFAGAIGELGAAMRLAKTAAEIAAIETRTSWVESNQAAQAGPGGGRRAVPVSSETVRGPDPGGEPQEMR